MIKIKETDLVNQILDYLKYTKVFTFRVNTMGNYNPKSGGYYKNPRLMKGVPDILCCIKGKFIGIECKVGLNKQSESQKEFQDNLRKAEGLYWLAYSLNEVIEKLASLKS